MVCLEFKMPPNEIRSRFFIACKIYSILFWYVDSTSLSHLIVYFQNPMVSLLPSILLKILVHMHHIRLWVFFQNHMLPILVYKTWHFLRVKMPRRPLHPIQALFCFKRDVSGLAMCWKVGLGSWTIGLDCWFSLMSNLGEWYCRLILTLINWCQPMEKSGSELQ